MRFSWHAFCLSALLSTFGGMSLLRAADPAPASLTEVVKVIDLQKLPLLKDADKPQQSAATVVRYTAPSKVTPAFDFYEAALAKLGWKVSTEPGGKLVSDDYGQGMFLKQGYQLSLSIFPDASKPGTVSVTLMNLGNIDTRKLPAPPNSKVLYGAPASTIHVTPAKVAEVAARVSQELKSRGWRQFVPPFTALAENPDQVQLTFFQKGFSLSAFIAVAPAQGGQTTVQYSTTLLVHELPAPADAEKLEFDTNRPYLACKTSQKPAELAEFYKKALTELGWKWRDANKAEGTVATWFCDGSDKSVLVLELTQKDTPQSDLKIERISAELIAEMNKPKSTKPPADTKPKGVLAARKIPLPKGVGEAEYDADAKEVRFSSRQPVKALIDFYRKELTGQGWKEDKDFTVAEENVGSMSLKKGSAEIEFEMLNLGLGGGTDVTISGDGMSWEPAKE